jgi:hypothetical protein
MSTDQVRGPAGSGGRRQHAGLPRAIVLAAVLAGVTLLTAACGSGGAPAAGQSKAYQKALEFVQCMRTHGMPTFPDPTSQGTVSDSQANVNSPQVLSAYGACRSLLPAGALQLSAAQQQELITKGLKFAACMRAHGITNFPDPSIGGSHISRRRALAAGIDPSSPLFQAAQRACRTLLPGGGRVSRVH